ncbi:hypothetical protein EV421DRAFT_1742344 [Armillaria borealis]|uniref:Uncharacterized protein n=1 Tax=Armillaria borealis TaxID=47425 RepID=A0AA39IYX7_9AGAR|nr:hypothetical protein EV421DRAFT_1742344 [Armillaria borealis]
MQISLKDCILIKTHFFDYTPDTSRRLLEDGPRDDSVEAPFSLQQWQDAICESGIFVSRRCLLLRWLRAVRYNSNQNVDSREQEGFGKAMRHDQKSDESASSTQR